MTIRSRHIEYRWLVATVLLVAYSIQYLDRVKTNVLMPFIAQDIELTTSDIGTGAFLMAIFGGPAQMVSGWMTDRVGGKRVLICSIIAWSSMTAWMGMIETRSEYFVRMALFGFFVGTEYVPSARILVRWFSREGRARAQALLSLAWILTPAWASVIVTHIAFHTGDWRIVFYLTAALGLLPLALIVLFIYDRPEQYPRVTKDDLDYAYADEIAAGSMRSGQYQGAKEKILAVHGLRFVDFFKSSSFRAVICVDIVMQIIMYSALVWIPLYLSDVFGFLLDEMGLWSSVYFFSGAIGSLASSYFSDKVFHGDRRIMILTSFCGLLPFVALLANLDGTDKMFLFPVLCGMGFFASMAWGPLLAVPAEVFTPEVYGKAMGFINGMAHTIAAFSAKAFAMLIYTDDGQKSYVNGWYFICLCIAIGIVAAWFVRPNHVTLPVD